MKTSPCVPASPVDQQTHGGFIWKHDAGAVELSLGTLNVSSLVIVTANPQLRAQLQDRYQKMFAANVAKLKTGMK